MEAPWRLLVALAACTAGACSYYDASLLSPKAGEPADASSDQGSGVCQHAQPPSPPTVVDAGGDKEFVILLRTIDFLENGDFKTLGFDQDRTCTCQGEGLSCTPPSGMAEKDQCDGPGGRDNSVSALIRQTSMLGLSSARFNQDIDNGGKTVALRVQGYNGQPDDDRVDVAWLVPADFVGKPAWNGQDVWPVRKSCLDGDLDHPKATDPNAYVSGGKLVASLQKNASLQLGGLAWNVIAAYIVVDLVPSGDGYRSDHGMMTGMWNAREMLGQLPAGSVLGAHLCTDHAVYPQVKKLICNARDIASKSSLPSDPCDSISMAFAFTAEPARIGGVTDEAAPTSPCTPATDPANDSCDEGP
ncbi:MAG: hypothetical protein HY898_16245 [Deltaproteobacteria bacterium]|nr:hypothetical protein [Deltaproteobacteria bacterium]